MKTDRGTSYKVFIYALDEIQGAYYEIYSERAGLSSKEFRMLDLTNPRNLQLHDKVKKGIPMNISLAEPSKIAEK